MPTPMRIFISIKYFLKFSYNAKKIHLILKLILKISDTYVFDSGGSQKYNFLRLELFLQSIAIGEEAIFLLKLMLLVRQFS